jgi:predicted O-methyltransferase YrrM
LSTPLPRDHLEALAAKAEQQPRALLALARYASAEQALALARRALALAPDDMALRAEAWAVMSAQAPPWHFRIVRDGRRNRAFDAAIRRAVTPDSRVLDIGAGTGLLAMMAARAGAGRVVTCEANPAVAVLAREVIAANGYGDRITVIPKHSSDLDAAADIGGAADVIVSEIVSNDLVGQGVLETLADACNRLAAPGAVVIPARGAVRIALAEDRQWRFTHRPTDLGFDLSAFDVCGAPLREASVSDRSFELRSEPADLFSFDFAAATAPAPVLAGCRLTSRGGTVNAIAQWIALGLDREASYENAPGPREISCWAVLLHRLQTPRETRPGETLAIGGQCERQTLRLWADN